MAMVPTAELLSSTTVSAVCQLNFFTQEENTASLNKTTVIMVVIVFLVILIKCFSQANLVG
jgi:preprotein translocase subunit SecG